MLVKRRSGQAGNPQVAGIQTESKFSHFVKNCILFNFHDNIFVAHHTTARALVPLSSPPAHQAGNLNSTNCLLTMAKVEFYSSQGADQFTQGFTIQHKLPTDHGQGGALQCLHGADQQGCHRFVLFLTNISFFCPLE